MDTNILFIHLGKTLAIVHNDLLTYHNHFLCSGEVHSVVCVQLSRGHVISERLHHKTTGSSHSTSATLMPER